MFRDAGPRARNEMEAVRIGWSGISQSSGFTVVEHNVFENVDGDPEIVSVKAMIIQCGTTYSALP